jgi:hypothetical protein
VGRPERLLDPDDGPVEWFAVELRRLREGAGRPGYRELSGRAHYSVATLAEAAGGRSFPSLAVTLAYVTACGGDQRVWEARWRSVAAVLAAGAANDSDGTGVDGVGVGDGVVAPYLGFRPFEAGDAERFFGRRRLVDELVSRLAEAPLMAVVGESGSGKSSVLRAGVVPALARGAIRGSAEWPVLLLTPGDHPVAALAAELAGLTGRSAQALRDELWAEPSSIGSAIGQALPATAGDAHARVVLVIDQFEEIFTRCRDAGERVRFVECLLAAANANERPAEGAGDEGGAGGGGKVVIGVRADGYVRCRRYPALAAALADRQVRVDALSDEELREVVTGPAAHAGLRVEQALVEVIVEEARDEPGALPLVSQVLLEIWRGRKADALTLVAYRGAGGIRGQLAQTAEQVFTRLDEPRRQIAQRILVRLTTLGEGAQYTPRRARLTELLDGTDRAMAHEVMDQLISARLITTGENEAQIAHQALIRHWPYLHEWLNDNRDMLCAHRRLTEAATEWEHHNKDDELLYRGTPLTAWDTYDQDLLNTSEHTFLAASRHQAGKHAAARRRTRLAIAALLSALVALGVLAAVADGDGIS